MFKSIISTRKINKAACYDIIYEWEDVIAKELGAKIQPIKWIDHKFWSKLSYLTPNYKVRTQNLAYNLSIGFILNVSELRYVYKRNIIPIFLDVWNDSQIMQILNKMGRKATFFLTSNDVYERTKKLSLSTGALYCPLSIPDTWQSVTCPPKTIDVVQVGRRNQVLHDYMLMYIKSNPCCEYVYSTRGTSLGELRYTSNLRGDIGPLKNRIDYKNLLQSARISLVSSPAVDNSRSNANGIDFPTPRFYESAIANCHLVGRYGPGPEFRALGIDKICKLVSTYQNFKETIEICRKTEVDSIQYKNFLQRHLTSTRISEIVNALKRHQKQ